MTRSDYIAALTLIYLSTTLIGYTVLRVVGL